MSMLARYKKSGGMMELLKLIEESAEPKCSQLLSMVANEDAEFAAQIQARIYSFDKLKELNEDVWAEIIAAAPPKFVALSLCGESEEFVKTIEKCLGKKFAEYKMEKEIVQEKPPTDVQIDAARRKLLTEARKLEKEGKIKMPLYDAGGEMIADERQSTASGDTLSNESTAGASIETGPTSGTGPSMGSGDQKLFAMEAPPPGLTGERFETYLKKQLGF